MNSGRIRYDFLERLNNSSLQFIGTMDKGVESVIKNIEQAVKKGIEEKEKNKKNVDEFIKKHEEKIGLMNKIKREIIQ